MSIKIVPHPRRIQCDLCGSRDTFMITRIGGRAVQFFTICRDDLKSFVEEGMKLFEVKPAGQLEDDLTAQLEAKDSTIEQLHAKLDELAKIEPNALQIELDASKAKIAELEVKLAAKPKPTTKTVRKPKGKR